MSNNDNHHRKSPITLTHSLYIALLIAIVLGLIFVNDAKEQSKQNSRDIKVINQTVEYMNASQTDFFNDRNIAFNNTFQKLDEIWNEIRAVLKVQINNEDNIIGNLTDHRVLQNVSRDEAEIRQNNTITIVNQTFHALNDLINIINFNSNKSLHNQENFFLPWQNESFNRIYDALNITNRESNFTINGKS